MKTVAGCDVPKRAAADDGAMDDSNGWKPPTERPMWPYILLVVVVVGVAINVLLTV